MLASSLNTSFDSCHKTILRKNKGVFGMQNKQDGTDFFLLIFTFDLFLLFGMFGKHPIENDLCFRSLIGP